MKSVTILNQSTGTQVGKRIGCAETALSRLVGLLGRKDLPTGGGVWIRPSSGIHTFGMRFAIDVVGLDAGMRVVKLWRNVKPQRVTPIATKVRSVLELAAGEIDARSICLGHVLVAIPSPIEPAGFGPSGREFFPASSTSCAFDSPSERLQQALAAPSGAPAGEWPA